LHAVALKSTISTHTHAVMDVSHGVNHFYAAALKPTIPLMHRAAMASLLHLNIVAQFYTTQV